MWPFQAREHLIELDREATRRRRRYGVYIHRNFIGAPFLSLGIHIDWHTPTLDLHLLVWTIQIGCNVWQKEGRFFYSKPGRASGHTDNCQCRPIRPPDMTVSEATMPQGDSSIPARGRCTCVGTVPVARAYHDIDCPDATAYDKQRWWADMVRNPKRAAVEMSGMSDTDLAELRREFG